MEDYQNKLRLIYKNKIITLKFYPRNYDQLRDTFLSLYHEKSYKTYIFKSYLNDQFNRNSIIILEEGGKFAENINLIKILKNPAIFIYVLDEVDKVDEFDKNNVKFIAKKENKLGFELNRNKWREIIERLMKETELRLHNCKQLEKRVGNLNLALKEMKDSMDLSQSQCKQKQENINNILNNLDRESKELA